MLEKECEDCRGEDVLGCVDRKSKLFVERHFEKDMRFIRLAREELLK